VKSDNNVNYGYFENVLILETANDVIKPKIMNIVSKSKNPKFNKPLRINLNLEPREFSILSWCQMDTLWQRRI
jgi:hypothetical protein